MDIDLINSELAEKDEALRLSVIETLEFDFVASEEAAIEDSLLRTAIQ